MPTLEEKQAQMPARGSGKYGKRTAEARIPKIAVNPPEISLTRGLTTIVDIEDYALVCPYSWRAFKCPNANTIWAIATIKDSTGVWKTVYMHRLILGLTDPGIECDHKDGNGLNNRRGNLRPATRPQNARNKPKNRGTYTSKYKGVSRRGNQWFASIKSQGITRSLACQSELEAARTYNNLARECTANLRV